LRPYQSRGRSFLIGYDRDLDRKSLIVRECVSRR
jgi:hypothetical protein